MKNSLMSAQYGMLHREKPLDSNAKPKQRPEEKLSPYKQNARLFRLKQAIFCALFHGCRTFLFSKAVCRKESIQFWKKTFKPEMQSLRKETHKFFNRDRRKIAMLKIPLIVIGLIFSYAYSPRKKHSKIADTETAMYL